MDTHTAKGVGVGVGVGWGWRVCVCRWGVSRRLSRVGR